MDRIFVRNFIIFFFLLVLCSGTLLVSLVSGNRQMERTDDLVAHTQEVISHAESLAASTQGMLAAQRAFVITRNAVFLESYEAEKNEISSLISILSDKAKGNLSQQSRIQEVRNYFNDLTVRLEERIQKGRYDPEILELSEIAVIQEIKNDIIKINREFVKETKGLLNNRAMQVEQQKTTYFTTLIIGVSAGTVLLLVLNGLLLSAKNQRSRAEKSLQETEQRFQLAVEGTKDGIFDWDFISGSVYYSAQYFKMLGYDVQEAVIDTIQKGYAYIHSEDQADFEKNIDQYLQSGQVHFIQEIRMRSADDQWRWIQVRARVVRDDKGHPCRMVGAHTDVTDQKNYQQRLKDEKNIAEEANRAKSDFLAHMSHEIRTPLTAINGIAEIFEKNQSNLTDKQRKLVFTLSSSTTALKDLINDILDFSKIESGELELEKKSFLLDELFTEIISIMSMTAHQAGIGFEFKYRELEGLTYTGDKMRLRQILVNLIGNAIKFTQKGSVSVEATAAYGDNHEPQLTIQIQDTGIGIAEENLELIFERFKQEDPSVTRRHGGTGLGLPISKNLAGLMGGDISVKSRPGQGTVFTMTLPFSEFEREIERRKQRSQNENEAPQRVFNTNEENKPLILVAEDFEGNIVVLSYLLDELGCEYEFARSGEEAVRLWQERAYNIVLMDIQMPEMDGFTATREIRRLEKDLQLSSTPIIGMTAHALIGDKDKCIESGMNAYLPKPIDGKDLKDTLTKFIVPESKTS